jgi:hypothetical protein
MHTQRSTKCYQKSVHPSPGTTIRSSQPHCITSIKRSLVAPAQQSIHLRNSDGSGTSAREGLNSHDLEVEVLVGEAVLGPGVEVSSGVDGARSTLALPDGPVLGEGAGAGDGGLVGAGVGALHVSRAVNGDGAELGHARGAGVEAAVGFNLWSLVSMGSFQGEE